MTVVGDLELTARTVALLAHYGVLAHDGVVADAHRSREGRACGAVVHLEGQHRATISVERCEIVVRNWAVEDLAHGIGVACGDVVPARLGRLEVLGPDSVVRVNERPVALSRTERRLIRHLARHPTVVHSRQHLIEHVWPITYRGRADVVDTYVSYLRQKLPDPWRLILRTEYGSGYSVHPPFFEAC